MAHILALSNQKGGVGKTTTAINLAASLASLEQRVLVIDVDPQGNASSGLGVDQETAPAGVLDVMVGQVPLEQAIWRSEEHGLDVLPCTPDLVGADLALLDLERREHRLRLALADVRADYDWILIDCPPSLGLLTLNALVAADRVLIPLQAEYYAMEGLSQLLRTITAVRRGPNPSLRREGIVITMYDHRTNLSRDVASQVRELFGDEVFSTLIPRNVRLGEAPSHGLAVRNYAPSSRGAKAYMQLATELLERHGQATVRLREAL